MVALAVHLTAIITFLTLQPVEDQAFMALNGAHAATKCLAQWWHLVENREKPFVMEIMSL